MPRRESVGRFAEAESLRFRRRRRGCGQVRAVDRLWIPAAGPGHVRMGRLAARLGCLAECGFDAGLGGLECEARVLLVSGQCEGAHCGCGRRESERADS